MNKCCFLHKNEDALLENVNETRIEDQDKNWRTTDIHRNVWIAENYRECDRERVNKSDWMQEKSNLFRNWKWENIRAKWLWKTFFEQRNKVFSKANEIFFFKFSSVRIVQTNGSRHFFIVAANSTRSIGIPNSFSNFELSSCALFGRWTAPTAGLRSRSICSIGSFNKDPIKMAISYFVNFSRPEKWTIPQICSQF